MVCESLKEHNTGDPLMKTSLFSYVWQLQSEDIPTDNDKSFVFIFQSQDEIYHLQMQYVIQVLLNKLECRGKVHLFQ